MVSSAYNIGTVHLNSIHNQLQTSIFSIFSFIFFDQPSLTREYFIPKDFLVRQDTIIHQISESIHQETKILEERNFNVQQNIDLKKKKKSNY